MNGNSKPHLIYNDTFHDSERNISQLSSSPDCVSANIPAPQLQCSPKEGFNSILSFWSEMEQASSRSASVTTPRCTLPMTNGFSRLRGVNGQLSSGTTSDMDSISNSTSSKPLTGEAVKAPDSSVPSIHSEESSDIDNLSTTYEIVVPPKPPKIMKSQSTQPKTFLPPNGVSYGEYTNLSVPANPQPRLITIEREESPPILPPKSPLLRSISRINGDEKSSRTPSLNGCKTMPHLNGNGHDFEAKRKLSVQPVKVSAIDTPVNCDSKGNCFNPKFRYSFHRPPEKPPKLISTRSSSVYPRVQTMSTEKPLRPSSEMQTSRGLIQVRYPNMSITSSLSTSRMEANPSPTRTYYRPPPRRFSTSRIEGPSHHHHHRGYSNGESKRSNSHISTSPCLFSGWRSSRPSSEMRHHPSNKASNRSTAAAGGSGATDTSSNSPNASDESLVTVRIWPSPEGQYGFNVHGGVDYKKPVIVTRVGENLPAGTATPRLHRGDQIIRINDRDISDYTQDQVISTIQKAAKSRTGYLELVVKPDSK
ncbi:unnamed protein product [Hydatigera taeniaeformis]|uniref:PDZ domain-containing protein n=1 Tax=Hydatigena taeniaeformis TaxID=6205 RepID=A0A0R3X4H6_HYDTA|nr:unnamed protein product [Hydatigera taeniaeformis]